MAAVVMAIKSAASAGSEKKKHVDKHVDVALQFISGMLDVPREDWLKAGVLQKKSRTQGMWKPVGCVLCPLHLHLVDSLDVPKPRIFTSIPIQEIIEAKSRTARRSSTIDAQSRRESRSAAQAACSPLFPPLPDVLCTASGPEMGHAAPRQRRSGIP